MNTELIFQLSKNTTKQQKGYKKLLASIQIIKRIREHKNAHSLEICEILGWQCVVKKGDFKVGDLVIYIQIDTILPDASWCQFMKDRGFRVKSISLRKELSQGLVFPCSILPPTVDFNEGCDVSKSLGVTKHEKTIPRNSESKGKFPSHVIQITDEERIQNIPYVIEGVETVDITLKHDGTSLTYIRECQHNGVFGEILCSRKKVLKRPDELDSNHYWNVYKKYNLCKLPKDIVVQGELCGPGIQGNKEKLSEYKLYIFNVFSQIDGMFTQDAAREFCSIHGLDTVTLLYHGPTNRLDWTINGLLDLADKQKYTVGSQAEGIVLRPDGESRVSFKVISNKFALKNNE